MAYAEPEPPPLSEIERLNRDLDQPDRTNRVQSAIALRIAGANYSEIAETLGYSTVELARQAVERGLASTVTEEDRVEQRKIASRRLERLLRGIYVKATDEEHPEQLSAARTALALIDRHIRLNGLDQPTEVAVYSPTERQMQDFLREQAAKMMAGLPRERDIIEGEIVDE